MRQLVEHARTQFVTDQEIAYLADGLARSGRVLSHNATTPLTDMASTGGPTSLSTLLCPLFLRAMGFQVAKLGVAGRPAGSIDVMRQIAGFRIVLSDDEVATALKRCGYAHFIAKGQFAPKDGQLFDYRKKVNAVAVPSLAMASLLSKKIAVGLDTVGIDVRVAPHGNFGSDWQIAKGNSERFVRVANCVKIRLVCFLSDATCPYQPYVGRGEALYALSRIFQQSECSWLENHTKNCFKMAKSLVQSTADWRDVRSKLRLIFEDNLREQGSTYHAFESAVSRVETTTRRPFTATKDGFVHINLGKLRSALVNAQNACRTDRDQFPDPAGLILRKNAGDYCTTGESLADVRCPEHLLPALWAELNHVFGVISTPELPRDIEEIRYA